MLWIRMTLADDGWGSNISYELLAIILALVAMSALGQKPTYALQQAMSALHPIATAKANFRKGPCLLYPRKRTCAVQQRMSALGRFCCKSRKLQGYEFFAKTRNEKQSSIRIASIALPKSPVSLT